MIAAVTAPQVDWYSIAPVVMPVAAAILIILFRSIARERVRTLVDSGDGFYIAEMDMKLRGPGEFFGTRQSGLPSLQIGSIVRDADVLEVARNEAAAFVAHPPSEQDLRRAVTFIRDHWQRRYGLVQVG